MTKSKNSQFKNFINSTKKFINFKQNNLNFIKNKPIIYFRMIMSEKKFFFSLFLMKKTSRKTKTLLI